METPTVRLAPWSEDDLDLLRRINAPEMTEHLGGPETDEQVVARHERYLKLDDKGRGVMFTLVVASGLKAGSIGYWEREWQGELVYETGWGVLPEFQGQGIATAAALAVVDKARAEGRHADLHAYPSVGHPASNAICRKAGFTFVGEYDFEYPAGNLIRSNDWRLRLLP
ncbi:GNAT family N-acetyltransferase [Nonomuraea rhizosphaerae]|uniref:GNAT family N-acetyltransferase n=1 Tax=Nonomuraea rhizosphaerae TaxID=2665663 RepID=UPI001C5DB825|nr:GNAT family N-acetyltransferase [Nonomuraea rhizosphaerae]